MYKLKKFMLYATIAMMHLSFSRALHYLRAVKLNRKALGSSASRVDISSVEYANFGFVIGKTDLKSRARLATIITPHGEIECPNFVFCATKAAMKAVTTAQLRQEGTQIILSNTYHLMLTPGSQIVEKMGGLQRFTNWNGPMLTDSGGYQIFSMGFGSVSNEIKGKRDTIAMGWNQTLVKIDEQGATFRSYVDGTIHNLTPERSVEIQKQLGADLIVVLDECTPFNVDKQYTEDSMRRSHRWAVRSLEEFVRQGCIGKQALYGIIQGGVYEDLRVESCEFVNQHAFFGTAIGGSLGATKGNMHDIVAFTRSHVRDDRPVHLLGIGGVRDIFHGVRQGIDTFDCVHPTRLGRHGGALVPAAFWDEEDHPEEAITAMTYAKQVKQAEKARVRRLQELRRVQHAQLKSSLGPEGANNDSNSVSKSIAESSAAAAGAIAGAVAGAAREEIDMADIAAEIARLEQQPFSSASPSMGFRQRESGGAAKSRGPVRTVREHISLDKSRMRNDPRPIDATCQCYTCQNYSRAYLHHLFKARESLGGTLVTIHNIHFMNRLMAAIRQGIATDTLDDVERYFVHPDLAKVADQASSAEYSSIGGA